MAALVFTSQLNLIVDSGTHPSLHTNCHHQIIYAKFNLKIQYPPRYSREVWQYKDSNDDFIKRAINHFNWERPFENKNVDEKVLRFNKTILNILNNFIPHELIVCMVRLYSLYPWSNQIINSQKNQNIQNPL